MYAARSHYKLFTELIWTRCTRNSFCTDYRFTVGRNPKWWANRWKSYCDRKNLVSKKRTTFLRRFRGRKEPDSGSSKRRHSKRRRTSLWMRTWITSVLGRSTRNRVTYSTRARRRLYRCFRVIYWSNGCSPPPISDLPNGSKDVIREHDRCTYRVDL